MNIAMALQMSGTRYDNTPWPAPGVAFEVPDSEGEALVRAGQAVRAEKAYVEARNPDPEPDPLPVTAGPADTNFTESYAAGATEMAMTPAASEPAEAPGPADPKQAWVDYAVSQGTPAAEARDLTKQQLMQVYGGRL